MGIELSDKQVKEIKRGLRTIILNSSPAANADIALDIFELLGGVPLPTEFTYEGERLCDNAVAKHVFIIKKDSSAFAEIEKLLKDGVKKDSMGRMYNANKIAAIKYARDLFGTTLKSTKNLIERTDIWGDFHQNSY